MSEPLFRGRKHPDADCEGCAFYAENHIVNDLPIDATVAAIAELPGNYEVRSKTPISGPAGNVLDGALEDVGITKVARLNMVQCAGKIPSANVFHRCLPALHADLDRLPDLKQALLLGGPPAKEFLNEPITTARIGAPRHNEQHDIEVVATWHPGYFMHNADRYPSFVHDVSKLAYSMPVWEEPIYFVWDEPDEAIWALDRLLEHNDKFVVDIEVGVDKDLMGHPERYAWLCIGVCVEKGVVHIFGEEALKSQQALDLFDRMMQTKEITCHNGKFDLAAFKNGRLYFDTMIASYILDERQGVHSLDFLSQELLGSPNWKHIVKPYLAGPNKTYADIPRDILYKYCAFDVHNTWLLEDYFRERLTSQQLELQFTLCEVSDMLMHAEQAGVKLDIAYMESLSVELLAEMAVLEKATERWVFNPRSPQQVTKALAALGQPVKSTNKDELAIVRRKAKPEVIEFIDALLAYKKKQKLHSTYVKGLMKNLYQGRIHPSFLIHGTTTGRLSCKAPNIMNQPRGPLIRTAYIPDADKFVFVQVDYKTAELRTLAIEANDPYLISVLGDETRDIHNEVSRQFFGEVFSKDQRVRAKAVVFGLSYGREAHSIAEEFDISDVEAMRYMKTFFDLIPEVVAWQEDIRKRVLRGEDLVNPFGRTRRFHLITKQNQYDVVKQAFAFVPQSIANDLCLMAAAELYHQYKLDIRILVHDSILVQCKPDEAHDVAILVGNTMQRMAHERYSDKIPFYTDAEIGTSWGALA